MMVECVEGEVAVEVEGREEREEGKKNFSKGEMRPSR